VKFEPRRWWHYYKHI